MPIVCLPWLGDQMDVLGVVTGQVGSAELEDAERK